MPTASAAAAQFGSLELAYIDVGGHQIAPEHIPTSGITVAAWVKVDSLDAAQEIFAAHDGVPEDSPVLHAEIREEDYRFAVRSGGSATIGDLKSGEAVPPVAPVFGQWHHVAMVYDKATATQSLWINGELAVENIVDEPQDMAADWNGGARAGTTVGGSRPFLGLMDELYIYSRALSPEENRRPGQRARALDAGDVGRRWCRWCCGVERGSAAAPGYFRVGLSFPSVSHSMLNRARPFSCSRRPRRSRVHARRP